MHKKGRALRVSMLPRHTGTLFPPVPRELLTNNQHTKRRNNIILHHQPPCLLAILFILVKVLPNKAPALDIASDCSRGERENSPLLAYIHLRARSEGACLPSYVFSRPVRLTNVLRSAVPSLTSCPMPIVIFFNIFTRSLNPSNLASLPSSNCSAKRDCVPHPPHGLPVAAGGGASSCFFASNLGGREEELEEPGWE